MPGAVRWRWSIRKGAFIPKKSFGCYALLDLGRCTFVAKKVMRPGLSEWTVDGWIRGDGLGGRRGPCVKSGNGWFGLLRPTDWESSGLDNEPQKGNLEVEDSGGTRSRP